MSEPISEERLRAIEALDKKRTPGGWCAFGPAVLGINADGRTEDEETYDVIPTVFANDTIAPDNWEADYAFIAACSEDIPELLREVRRLQQRERELLILMAAAHGDVTDKDARKVLGDKDWDAYYAKVDAARDRGVEIVTPQAKS